MLRPRGNLAANDRPKMTQPEIMREGRMVASNDEEGHLSE
jgi:hypothetical protein